MGVVIRANHGERDMELGDAVERALASVGVTKERVQRWLGECACDDRQQKLNALSIWAKRVLLGRKEHAREHLSGIIGDETRTDPPT